MMNTTSDNAAYFRRNVENSRLANRNLEMLNPGGAAATFGIRNSTRSSDVSFFGDGSGAGGGIGAPDGSRDRNRGLIGEEVLLITAPSCRQEKLRGRPRSRIEDRQTADNWPHFEPFVESSSFRFEIIGNENTDLEIYSVWSDSPN
jgi:hypothetical protein